MAILIDNEAIRNLQSPLDIEKFGNRYKTETELFTFPNPNLETIDKNLFYLLKNSQELEFELKYKYRPDYMSYDYYGTTILWELLMYVNSVFSAEDFDLIKVVVPSLQSITDILQDTYRIPNPDELTAIEW
jgi:alpha-L-fucosidase